MTSSLIRPSTSSADRQTDRRCHLLVSLLNIIKRIKTDSFFFFFYFFFTIIITYNNTRAGACVYTIAVAVVPHTYLRRQKRTTATIRRKYYNNNMFLVTLQTIRNGNRSSEQNEISTAAALRYKCIIIEKTSCRWIYKRTRTRRLFFVRSA